MSDVIGDGANRADAAGRRSYGVRGRLGVIVPPTNTVNETEWQRMAPDGVTVHATRMPLHTDTESPDGERALFDDLAHAAGDLAAADMSVIAYGCTAGSMVEPLDRLTNFMRDSTGRPAVATAPSIVAALRALGVTKVALASPYSDAMNAHEASFLAACGIESVAMAGLGLGANGPEEFKQIARQPDGTSADVARSVDRPNAEAIVISCTDFASLETIEPLEAELGKPVVTSNQATFWAALRAAGIDDKLDGFGILLRDH